MNRVNEKNCRSEKIQCHREHRKVKYEMSQALVMINLYMKFNVLKVADRRIDGRNGRADAPGDDNRHPPKFWLRPKNGIEPRSGSGTRWSILLTELL